MLKSVDFLDPTYNHVVMDSQELDLIFGALADPIRRGILVSLSTGEQNVSQLTNAFNVSQPAISRHLKTLVTAGLIAKEKRGREQFVHVNARQAEQAAAWIAQYSAFWKLHFDEVERVLKQKKGPKS
jgi:DNA-binding transcriptional ArsR family regulator